MSLQGIILEPGGGKMLAVGDSRIAFKLTGEHARGLAVFEHTIAPGSDTRLHIHRKMEELFYVLEGELEFRVDERKSRAGPGTFIFVPPGVAHAVSNPGARPARTLVIVSPPGFEKYFEELSRIVAEEDELEPAVIALRKKYDTDHVGNT